MSKVLMHMLMRSLSNRVTKGLDLKPGDTRRKDNETGQLVEELKL
jgi:hypothetical protein